MNIDFSEKREIAKRIRKRTIELIHRTKSPHIGPSLSIVEILTALYFGRLNVSPDEPMNPDRDRFILSKGHACPSFYITLEERGFLSKEDIKGFGVNDGVLEHHPSLNVEKGVEVTSGSLGHGLALAAGMGIAAKHDKKSYTIFVLMGDGEMNEGSVWESIMFTAHHRLDNVTAVIDHNKMQALGKTRDVINLEPLSAKLSSFGWNVIEIDGHDFEDIYGGFEQAEREKNKPSAIIAHTVKGKGVKFMENELLWHYRPPDDEELKKAMDELDK